MIHGRNNALVDRYDFFKDSPASKEWRIVASYKDEKLWTESADACIYVACVELCRHACECVSHEVNMFHFMHRLLTR
jgi:hypothetical protein